VKGWLMRTGETGGSVDGGQERDVASRTMSNEYLRNAGFDVMDDGIRVLWTP
jgi:hypothetical protein